MKIERQPIVTTSKDRHGDQIPKDILKQFFKELPDPWVLCTNHDFSRKPIGIGTNKSFGEIKPDVWAIMMDIEVWDEEEFKKMRGFSFSYLRNKVTMNPSKEGDIEIIFNPNVLSDQEVNALVKLSNEDIQIDAREIIQKAFEIPFVLVIKFCTAAFFTAFFGKMGADTWDLLKKKISGFAAKRQSPTLPRPACQFNYFEIRNDYKTEIVIDLKVSELDYISENHTELHALINNVFDSVDDNIKRIAIVKNLNNSAWETEYVLSENDELI